MGLRSLRSRALPKTYKPSRALDNATEKEVSVDVKDGLMALTIRSIFGLEEEVYQTVHYG